MARAEDNATTSLPEAESGQVGSGRAARWVGKYRLLAELGRGGMASVYLAVARGIGGVNKLVVLKAVLPELESDPSSLAMFMDEARLAAQLNHPNVVQTYEVGTEGDRHVIVMEYLEGQTLGHLVQAADKANQPLDIALYLRIVIGALEGLHYAHELAAYDGSPLHLVHRDVSPQNIFVTYRGQAKVLDFGVAKAASSSTHTATGIVKGKIAYMAPEQMVGDRVDGRADVYSVGCMLWAAATGRKLWKDVQDVHIMRMVINGEIPKPRSVNPHCSEELERIVMKSLAAEPDHRYASAQALAEDLEHYVESLGRPATQKNVGAVISSLFEAQCAEHTALVERRLARALKEENGDPSNSRKELRTAGPSTQVVRRPRETSRPGGEDGGSVRDLNVGAELAQAKRGRRVWFGALGLVAVFGVAGAYYSSTLRQPAASPPLAAHSPSEEAGRRVERVTIAFRAEPSEAKIFLDDEELPTNPTSKLLDVDGKVHRLRAEAPGYFGTTSEFTAERDDAIALELKKVPSAEPALAVSSAAPRSQLRRTRPVVVRAAAPEPEAPPARSAKPATCARPFFVDSDGIKKVRPECL
jgi:serine/threonine protein kinase